MTTIEFNNHISNFENLVLGFAIKLTGNREDAKDLYQETIMRAFTCREGFTMGTNFKAWVTTIMRNCFINEYRKRRTRNNVVQPLGANPEAAVNQAFVTNNGPTIVMMKELRRMLNSLGEAHRIPFEMFFNGYEYQEIAEELNLPMGTVKSRIFFARKKMVGMIECGYGMDYFRRA